MISRLEAYRYRCFQKLDLALDYQHVLAGTNGAGKTTLLDIPALFGDMLSVKNINDAFFTPVNGRERARAENALELVHQLRGDYFILAIEVKLPDSVKDKLNRQAAPRWLTKFASDSNRPDTIRYEIALNIVNDELQVSEEHLFMFPEANRPEHGSGMVGAQTIETKQPWFSVLSRRKGEQAQYVKEYQTGKTASLAFGLRDYQLALSSIPADHHLYPAALWLQEYLLDSTFCYEPQWPAMRLAASPRDKKRFRTDGGSLAWQVWDLQESNPDDYEDWLELVQMALPSLNNVVAKKREDDSFCYLLGVYSNGMEVPSTSLSHGTLQILALTIIPFLQEAPYVLTLEEPENGIHPKAIEAVLEAMRLTRRTQLWVSTHSPVVLANTELDDIIVMRIGDDGATEVIKGRSHPRMKTWKGEIDLGSLFIAGVLD